MLGLILRTNLIVLLFLDVVFQDAANVDGNAGNGGGSVRGRNTSSSEMGNGGSNCNSYLHGNGTQEKVTQHYTKILHVNYRANTNLLNHSPPTFTGEEGEIKLHQGKEETLELPSPFLLETLFHLRRGVEERLPFVLGLGLCLPQGDPHAQRLPPPPQPTRRQHRDRRQLQSRRCFGQEGQQLG